MKPEKMTDGLPEVKHPVGESEILEILPLDIGDLPAGEAAPLLERAVSRIEIVKPENEFWQGMRENLEGAASYIKAKKGELASKTFRAIAGASLVTSMVSACAKSPENPAVLPPTEPIATLVSEIPTETQKPTSTPEAPKAGAEDEMSIAIQDYLNNNYTELGIYGVRQASAVSPEGGGGSFVFAGSLYKKEEESEPRNLPLLIKLKEDFSIDKVMLLERNDNFSGEAIVKYEFLGYTFDKERKTLINYGPVVQRLKTGEFRIMVDREWKLVVSPADRHIEPLKALLTGEELATPTAFLPTATPEPTETEELPEMPPLIQPESLALSLDRETLNLLAQINPEDLYQPPPGPDPNLHKTEIASYYSKADELIRIMGVQENEILRNQYLKFFNENWVVKYNEYRYEDLSYDIRGLGVETIYFRGPGGEGLGHSQAVGFLYGFTGDYVILQIKPGNNLTPEKTPDAFIAVEIRRPSRRTEGLVGLLTISEFGRSYQQYILKDGYNVPWFRYWSPIELQRSLGLLRGSIVITKGRQGDKLGTYEADMIYFFVLEMPSEEEQAKNNYRLHDFGKW